MKGKWISCIVLLVMVIGFAVAGVFLRKNNQSEIEGYVTTQATVIGHKKEEGYDHVYDDERMYAEIVSYTVDGVVYEATNSVWSNTPKAVGSKIEIAYDPQNPGKCVFVKSESVFPIVLFIMSGLCLLALILQIVKFVSMSRRLSEQ